MWMTRVSIQNPVFAAMVMVALCVLGLFSYAKLGVERKLDAHRALPFTAARRDPLHAGDAVNGFFNRLDDLALHRLR